MTAPQPPLTTTQNWSYEATVAEIEATVACLERGDLPLAEVFKQFEQAVHNLRQCESFLRDQQEQVDLLMETLNEPEHGY